MSDIDKAHKSQEIEEKNTISNELTHDSSVENTSEKTEIPQEENSITKEDK